jgi:toxin ParE1/3/4
MSAKLNNYRLSPRAKQDLEEIWLYTFTQWSFTQADSYISDLLSACHGLTTGEKLGVSAEDIRAGYFKHFCGSHAIYYTTSEHHLDIIRILHQSCDTEAHL